jgi:hypothetical protein
MLAFMISVKHWKTGRLACFECGIERKLTYLGAR